MLPSKESITTLTGLTSYVNQIRVFLDRGIGINLVLMFGRNRDFGYSIVILYPLLFGRINLDSRIIITVHGESSERK